MINLKKELSGVEGFLTDKEGKLLFEMSQNVKNGVIVEIGSWKGKSTICLALGSKYGYRRSVFAVDPHIGSPEHQDAFGGMVWTFDAFKKNIKNAGVEEIVKPILETSDNAVKSFNQDIGLLFVDGAHEYEDVKNDFINWFPKLSLEGIMAFHDTIGWEGPRKVVETYLYKSESFRDVHFVDSITYGRKVIQNNFFDRLKNRYYLFLRNISEKVRQSEIPKPIKKFGKKILEFVT